MKKKIITFFGFMLILVLVLIGYTSVKSLEKNQIVQDKQSNLSKILNQLGQAESDLKPITILIFFNSECEHCQWEIEEISNKIGDFNQYQLLLVSFEPEQKAIAFLNRYDLTSYYVKSTPENVMASFSGGVPQTLIYKKGKLIKHFKGEVKTEAILAVFERNECL